MIRRSGRFSPDAPTENAQAAANRATLLAAAMPAASGYTVTRRCNYFGNPIMANNRRGKRAGLQNSLKFWRSAGKDDRPSALRTSQPIKPSQGEMSPTGAAEFAAKYFACASIEEQPETHLVPRKSITASQFLQFRSPELETEPMRARQLAKDGSTVETTDNRLLWKSDRSLLRGNKPFSNMAKLRREGTIREGNNTRKYITVTENETQKASDMDKVIGPAIDGLDKL